ncbi:HEAT repeat [Desulfocicer vacuolatum DSM 3385]|uniref:HEAT repeat n=1 Tax=Desulfocicer vacuolatum DSM 3385 TaxID=1121400 RepID=A0A1W2BEL1_9BACT|nr:HEAT repeat domain-containing protein [Desulfocicer vacuolatum]SMC71271.1 HEAT repeat [Desulfocicer vacuolatum DSM 3385]
MMPTQPDNKQEPEHQNDLSTLVEHLSAPDPDLVQKAVIELKARKGADMVAALIPRLSSPDPPKQIQAMDILVASGPGILVHLGRAMAGADSDLRKMLLDIIRMVGTPEAQEYLIRFLFDEDVNVGVAAAEALGSSGIKDAVPHLIQCLDKEPWLQCAALKSLGRIGNGTVLPHIIALGHGKESLVRFCAVQAVGAIAHVDGVDFLVSVVESREEILIPHAVRGLVRILEKNPEKTRQVLDVLREKINPDALIACLGTANRTTVASAVALLGQLGVPMALDPLIALYKPANAALFDDLCRAVVRLNPKDLTLFNGIMQDSASTDAVKMAVISVMEKLNTPAAAKFLMSYYHHAHPDLKPEILMAMGGRTHSQMPALRDFLHEQLPGDSDDICLGILDALGARPHKDSIPFFLNLSTAQSDTVRNRAADLLSRMDMEQHQGEITRRLISPDDKDVLFALTMMPRALGPVFENHLVKLCRHNTPDIRKKAVARLGVQGNVRVLAAVTSCMNDPHDLVRRAAVRALQEFAPETVSSLLLTVVENDPDHWNRYEAMMGIKALSIVDVIPDLLKGLSRYPDLVKAAVLDFLGEQKKLDLHEQIKVFLQSPAAGVREAAREALTKIGSQ